MYDSLKQHCSTFHLYVISFDDKTFQFLKSQNLENLTVISLKEFEDENLLNIKSSRTPTEYCWTCTPSTILYCIKTFNLQNCTYIDADMLFYSDPKVLIEEMGTDSVLITEHRYTSERDLTDGSGKYCVQFVGFKNDERGMKVLNWWREACLDWCFNRYEDGKFGDQKYLDDWTMRFEGVHELKNLGGGLAPWNIQQYTFNKKERIIGFEKSTGKNFETVFFHYHGLKFYDNDIVAFTDSGYSISKNIKKLFYHPYVKLLVQKARYINNLDASFNPNGSAGTAPNAPFNLMLLLKFYWYEVKESPAKLLKPNIGKRISNHHFHYINNL